MKLKLLSAAVLAAGLCFGMGGASSEAQAGVRIFIGAPVYGYGYHHRHRHCHRYKIWRHGHRVWVRRCHRHY